MDGRQKQWQSEKEREVFEIELNGFLNATPEGVNVSVGGEGDGPEFPAWPRSLSKRIQRLMALARTL